MTGLTTLNPDRGKGEEICPVLETPAPDCYCLNLTSVNIPIAVHFCLRDFRDCPIYNKYMGYPEG